jgi:probable phosphoglycerate mutase
MNPSVSEPVDAPEDEALDELLPTVVAIGRRLLVAGERTELILVRHAQQRRSRTESRRPGGPRLSDLGRLQARLTGEYLAAEARNAAPVAAVYCSDLNRAHETAEIIAAATGGQHQQPDAELREVDMYSRDRGEANVSPAVQAKATQEFARTLRWNAFPNTEPGNDFRRRTRAALERIAAGHRNGRVVVVSHAGAIAAAFAELVDAGPDMFYLPGHASVNRIFHGNNSFVTHSLNEVGHLRAEGALTF